jgi:hypothetical protein
MGGTVSRQTISDHLNETVKKSVTEILQECNDDLTFTQDMEANCVVPEFGLVSSDTPGGTEFYEDNTVCVKCFESTVGLEQDRLQRQSYILNAQLGKDVHGNNWPEPQHSNDVNSFGSHIRSPVPELQQWQTFEKEIGACLSRCKACQFTGNSQTQTVKLKVSCVDSSTLNTDIQDKVVANVVQDIDDDKDIAASVAELLRGKDQTMTIAQHVKSIVTETEINTIVQSVKTGLTTSQYMTLTAGSQIYSGNAQNVFATLISDAVTKSGISTKMQLFVDQVALTKINTTNDTFDKLDATIEGAVEAATGAFFTTASLVGVMIMLVVTVGIIIMMTIFLPLAMAPAGLADATVTAAMTSASKSGGSAGSSEASSTTTTATKEITTPAA